MTTAYSYIRFSTPEQAFGDSSRRQTEQAQAYAEKHGLTLDTSLRDEGVSGYSGANRTTGALNRFLEMARRGQILPGSYLLVENFDRLSREHVMTALATLGQLVEAGINVVTLSNEKLYSKETLSQGYDVFEALFEMMRAHTESQRKSELVGKAWAEKRRKAIEDGVAQTSRCPGWLEKVGDRYELIPDRVAILKEIFHRLANGEGGGRIAADFNRRGVPTWGVRRRAHKGDAPPTGAARWHDSYIQKMRSSEAVIGHAVVKGGQIVRDYFPRAIDDAEFWAARIASEKRRTSSVRNRGGKIRNLLQGLGKCVHCGSTMVYVDKGARSSGPYLQCAGVTDGTACSNRTKWNYRTFEVMLPHAIGQSGRSKIHEALDPDRSLAEQTVKATIAVADAERRWQTLMAMVDENPGENIKREIRLRDDALTEARRVLEDLNSRVVVRDDRRAETYVLVDEVRRLRGDPQHRLKIAQRLLELIVRIDFDEDIATLILVDGVATVYRGGNPPLKSNAGWFVDGKNKLGDGEWKGKKTA